MVNRTTSILVYIMALNPELELSTGRFQNVLDNHQEKSYF